MSVKNYKISFPYGATSSPYSPSRPHRGNDRSAPCGTPVVIAGKTIGLVGTTGISTGCHLHTQAGSDIGTQNTINPTKHEFQSGTVVRTRNTNTGAWGKYVTIRNDSGVYVTYAHLSEVKVKVGQIIKENTVKLTRKQVGRLIFTLWGRDAKEDELQAYTQREAGDLVKRLIDDPQTTKQISRLLDQRSTAAKLKDKIISFVKGA